MNKLKWEQSPDYNIPIHLAMQSNILPIETKVFLFIIQKETFFLFINHTLLVIVCNADGNNRSFSLDSKHECNYLSSIETLVDIKQSTINKTDFVFASSKGNLYLISFSSLDYYSQMKAMISLKASSYKILQCNTESILCLIGSSLYCYKHSSQKNNQYQFTKSLIYQSDNKKEKIISASISTATEKANAMIIVFTNQDIKVIDEESQKVKNIICQYDSLQTYIGKVLRNKVYYLKAIDEIGIYDIETEKNESSIKFSSKKMFNKISFNKAIEVNDELILIVNESKCELYTYSFKYNSFNRETTLFDNKDYFFSQSSQLLFALGFDYRQMILKAKIGSFETNKNLPNRFSSINDKEEDNWLFDEIELGEFERKYEESSLLEVNKNKSIKRYKKDIAMIIKQINNRNYEEKKIEVDLIITYINNIAKEELIEYELEVYFALRKYFIFLFGSYSLKINWYNVNLQYIINKITERTQYMLQLSLENYDKNTYIKLYLYLKQLYSLIN